MKIFISWSGETSHKVALILKKWLQSVIQSTNPYVSSEDIEKGARWSTDIAHELDSSSFGILCVTPDNITAPWLNYEAGALGKSVGKSSVCPFLFRVKRSEIDGPLLQYQSTIFDKQDVLKLLKSINRACINSGETEIADNRLEEFLEVWWPSLESRLNELNETADSSELITKPELAPTSNGTDEYIAKMLEEILELSRTNQKLIRDPEKILLPDDIKNLLDGINSKHISSDKYRKLQRTTAEELVTACNDLAEFVFTMRDHGTISRVELEALVRVTRGFMHPLLDVFTDADMDINDKILNRFSNAIHEWRDISYSAPHLWELIDNIKAQPKTKQSILE